MKYITWLHGLLYCLRNKSEHTSRNGGLGGRYRNRRKKKQYGLHSLLKQITIKHLENTVNADIRPSTCHCSSPLWLVFRLTSWVTKSSLDVF